MKTIYLVRHGKAVERGPDVDDEKRSLLERGEQESRKMALRIKASGIKVNLLLSSPAKRALETANIFARTLRYPLGKIQLDRGFYQHPTGSAFLPAFRKLPDKVGGAMLFGHEPTLSEFASLLLPRFDVALPKSGLVGIYFAIESWKRLEPGSGTLKLIEFPALRKRSRRLFRQIADAELSALVQSFFEAKNERIGLEMKSRIRKCAAGLNARFVAASRKNVDG